MEDTNTAPADATTSPAENAESPAVGESPASEPDTEAAPPIDAPQAIATDDGSPQQPDPAPVATAEEETAPGPEAAVGAADASMGGSPKPTPVGSRTRTIEEMERHDKEIRDAEREVANAEEIWESLKEETSTAKKEMDKAIERMRKIIRSNGVEDAPLFNQPKAEAPTVTTHNTASDPAVAAPAPCPPLDWKYDEEPEYWHAQTNTGITNDVAEGDAEPASYFVHPTEGGMAGFDADEELFARELPGDFPSVDEAKAFAQQIEAELWAKHQPATNEPTSAASGAAPQDDNAWRAVELSALTPAIPPKKLELLANNTPPITTMGELADWQAKKGDPWWWKDLKGLGQGGQDKIVDAQAAYWEANGREKAPEPSPAIGTPDAAAEKPADDFAEDAVDRSTIEAVAIRGKHLSVNVARLTSGRWVKDYWVGVGALDATQKFSDSPSYPTKDEAWQAGIDAVREILKPARAGMKGRADKIALEITWALDAAEKSLSGKAKKKAS